MSESGNHACEIRRRLEETWWFSDVDCVRARDFRSSDEAQVLFLRSFYGKREQSFSLGRCHGFFSQVSVFIQDATRAEVHAERAHHFSI